MKAYGGGGGGRAVLDSSSVPPLMLNFDLDGGEWWISRSGRFIPREVTSGTRWIWGVRPRTGLKNDYDDCSANGECHIRFKCKKIGLRKQLQHTNILVVSFR
jgi:hypothetical protein